jgi:hypothetical protein
VIIAAQPSEWTSTVPHLENIQLVHGPDSGRLCAIVLTREPKTESALGIIGTASCDP